MGEKGSPELEKEKMEMWLMKQEEWIQKASKAEEIKLLIVQKKSLYFASWSFCFGTMAF